MTITFESLHKEIQLLRAELSAARDEIIELKEENKLLRAQLAQDSSNSSKPPSSDPLWKRNTRGSGTAQKSRKKRKPGGQTGHKGNKLKKFEFVDFTEEHKLKKCPNCESKNLTNESIIYRQVIDIPEPKFEVTEHGIWQYECDCCGSKVEGGHELGLSQEAQYGNRIKALVNYLNVYQLVPYKRTIELLSHLYGLKISQGTISNFKKELQKGIISFKDSAVKLFQNSSQVIHSDETGCMVDKKLHWVHVYSNELVTLLFGHEKRGKAAMEDIDILTQTNATVVHDRFGSYFHYENINHAICNAHIIRDIAGVKDLVETDWPDQILKLLLDTKAKTEQGPLSAMQITRLQNKYEGILRGQRTCYQKKDGKKKKTKGKPKRSKDHNLFLALWKYRAGILKFAVNPDVPFDNNLAERDLRMLKVKMKISNQFKSLEWLNVHNDLRSFIGSAKKQGLDIFDCIIQSLKNPNFAAQLAV